MNKKLIAVAVAGLLAAPMVAQAQTANVVLYGSLRLDLEYLDADASQPGLYVPNITRLSSNSSRFGLRGTEALGGGLNAIFQIENGSVAADAGGGTLAGRDTFIGLQGSWGTVKFGNFLAPYDDAHPIFGDTNTYLTSMDAMASLWANNGGYSKGTGSFDDRLGNSLRYDSPNIAGFTGGIQVSLYDDSGAGGTNDSMVWSMAGQYKNGPFAAILAYEANVDVRCYNGNSGGTNSTCGAPHDFQADDWAFTAAGAWDFGIVRVAGLYERLNYETPQGNLKRNLWGLFAGGPVFTGKWYVGFQKANDGSGPSTQRINGLNGGGDTGAYHLSISYNQPISKRTAWYAAYTRLDNEDFASYNLNINPYRAAINSSTNASVANPQGLEVNGFMMGMIHSF